MSSFTTGQKNPCPLVSITQVKGHLRLLRMFHNMRVTIEECKDRRIPAFAIQMDRGDRWVWFVTLAIDRFERWVKSLQFVPLEKFIRKHFPPIDVWMIWHAYLLNPCCYEEDCERLPVLQQLHMLNLFVVASINIGMATKNKPSESRVAAWHKQTGSYFDPFDAMAELSHKEIECPSCQTHVFVPFVNDNGTGYSEKKFSALCPLPGCRLKITKENLAVARFVRDLTEPGGGNEHYMAGSLFCTNGKRDPRQAKAIKDQLTHSSQFCRKNFRSPIPRIARMDWEKEIKEGIGYSWSLLKDAVAIALRNQHETTTVSILNAYRDHSPFSIDLVAAVLRQGVFIKKMDELGWIKPGAFKDNDTLQILEHSLLRYHCFLNLAATTPNLTPVPTLDIDLVWHSHQLTGARYGADCETYVGRRLDHPVAVEEGVLSIALDNTCRAWQSHFQVPYMQCGCPAPDATLFEKFIRNFQHFARPSTLLQAPLHPDHIPATHPSIHNAILNPELRGVGTFKKLSRSRWIENDLIKLSHPLVDRKKCSKMPYLEPPLRLEGFATERMTGRTVTSSLTALG